MQSYTRRQLKRDDKFSETTREAFQWASGHRQGTTFFLIAAVVVVALAVGLYFWHDHRSELANAAFTKAIRTLSAPLRPPGTPPNAQEVSFTSAAERSKQAQKEFAEIADKYSFTKPAAFARYLSGVAAFEGGDNAAAEQQLKTAAQSWDRDAASLAKLALANVYRSANRQADAAKLYGELRDHPTNTVSRAQAMLELAEMYQPTDPKQAATIYQQIQKENPADSAASQTAGAKLSVLNKK